MSYCTLTYIVCFQSLVFVYQENRLFSLYLVRYSVDFGKNEVEVLKHAANYLEVEKTQTILELLDSTQLKVVYQPYDWRLNS